VSHRAKPLEVMYDDFTRCLNLRTPADRCPTIGVDDYVEGIILTVHVETKEILGYTCTDFPNDYPYAIKKLRRGIIPDRYDAPELDVRDVGIDEVFDAAYQKFVLRIPLEKNEIVLPKSLWEEVDDMTHELQTNRV